MPQPVHYNYLIPFDFGPEAILDRPSLAAHIAAISALWNEIDARIGTFLTALLGGEAKTGISIYYAITNEGAKRAALEAICALNLSQSQHSEFQLILKTVGERYAERNRAIHGAWGISHKYPDALLWSDIRETVLLHADLMAIPGDKNSEVSKQLRRTFQKKIQVWKERDFKDVEDRIKSAYSELFNFTRPFIDSRLAQAGLKSSRREDRS